MTVVRQHPIVLLQGAFEIVHLAHVLAFEHAKAQGNHLIIAINSNELIRQYKQRQPVQSWDHKKRLIEAFRCVDEVVKATKFSPMDLLKKYDVDVYVVSRDWYDTKAKEIAYMKAKGGRVCVTRRFTRMSTTTIKERLLEEAVATYRVSSASQTSALLSI